MWVKTIFSFFLVLFIACAKHEGFRTYYGEIQGTTFSIKYDYSERDMEDEIDSILASMDAHFSTYIGNSMISHVNQSSVPIEVDDVFTDLWEKCWDLNIATNGFFDPTLEPILTLYDFDKGIDLLIDSSKIENALNQTGMHLIRLEDNILSKKSKEVRLNFNAVAQGYSVDMIADYFESIGVKNYMVEIGGELRVKGVNDKKELWVIGIDKPLINKPRELLVKTSLNDMSLATSGNYRKFKRINGINVGHIINPKTGYAEQSTVLSVSVLTPKCYMADGMATAFMNMPVEEIMQMDQENPDMSVIVIYLKSMDTTVYISPDIKTAYLN